MPTIYDSYRIEWDGNSLYCENDVIIGYNASNKTRLEFVNTSPCTGVHFTSIEFRTPLSRIGFDLPDDGKIELSLNPVLYGADSDLALFWEADDGKTGAAHMRVMIVESEYYHDEETEQQVEQAARINDAAVSSTETWSSRKIIDTLCPEFSVSGNPVTCTPVEGYPLGAVVTLEPIQSGTGDPSPDNVRPISGYDSVAVNERGKNLITLEHTMRGVYGYVLGATRPTECKVFLVNGATYTLSFDVGFTLPTYLYGVSESITSQHQLGNGAITGSTSITFTVDLPTGFYSIYLYNTASWTDQPFTKWQLEVGSTPTDYEPYQPGTIAALALPETIYGGTVDAVTGVGSKTWGFIASYNGESLPGEWISDRDVYSPGTTPTTGAQVAYKLAAPEPFQATGNQPIPALAGQNTVYTDGASLTASGRDDPLLTIQTMQTRMTQAEDDIDGLETRMTQAEDNTQEINQLKARVSALESLHDKPTE